MVRDLGPESHLTKAGTPTMGGLIIIVAATLSTLLWADVTNLYIIVALVSLLWMGAIGFLDDYLKVVQGKTRGLVGRYKMVGQWTFGLALGGFLLWNPLSPHPTTWTTVPFFSDIAAASAAPVFVLFTGAVVSGSSNAVNLTDGLDGLAAGLTGIAAATFGIFAYIAGRVDTSAYLGFFYLPGAGGEGSAIFEGYAGAQLLQGLITDGAFHLHQVGLPQLVPGIGYLLLQYAVVGE